MRQFDFMREGVAALDEFWRVCDARLSRKTANKFVGDILSRSRKRSLVYLYTAQVIDTIDKRIRKVQDFTSYSVPNRLETVYKTLIFRSGYVKAGTYMKTIYWTTEIPMMIYNTYEEVDMIDDIDDPNPCQEPPLIWQEAAAKCNDCGALITANPMKCDTDFGGCGSMNVTPIQPRQFSTWEEADSFAQKYWEKWFAEKGYMIKEK